MPHKSFYEAYETICVILGFKFIGNTALDLVKEGYEVPFGYEEAIGYMFGSEIRDKDGVAATVSWLLSYLDFLTQIVQMIFAQLAATLRARGVTVHAHLQELYRRWAVLSIVIVTSSFVNQGMDISRSVHTMFLPISSDGFWKDE